MKTYFCFITLLLLVGGVQAQKNDSLTISAGFMFNPQGYISLKDPKEGFKPFLPVMATIGFSKGKLSASTVYGFNANSIAVVVAYQCSPQIGMYLFQNKRVLQKGQYTSFGVTTPVAAGRAIGFVEIGSPWDGSGFFIYTGVFIPFKMKIK